MQATFESNKIGRTIISTFLVVTVAALVVWNLPSSKLRTEALRLTGPYTRAVGLDQNWSVFAPDPYRDSFFLSARVTFADGSHTTWTVPEGGDPVGTYWDFRWGKWAEWTIAGNPGLCSGTAAYVANLLASEARTPVEVELFVRRRPNARPGESPPHGAWKTSLVCSVDIAGRPGAS